MGAAERDDDNRWREREREYERENDYRPQQNYKPKKKKSFLSEMFEFGGD
jgi:hypothetical protein